jgi:DNA-binding PadR family transcriptional regulator
MVAEVNMYNWPHRYDRQRFLTRPRRERLFQRGDLKYIILQYLKDKPSYGYEIIRAMEERFHGFYVPSPGTIYPTLQMLEEMGYVTAKEQEGKKIYTITEEGCKFLDGQKECEERIKSQISSWWNPENINDIIGTMHEFERLAQLLRDKSRTADRKKLHRMREVLSHAYEEISKD